MKKIIALIITFSILFSLAACRKDGCNEHISATIHETSVFTENISESAFKSESAKSSPQTTQKRSASAVSTKENTTEFHTIKTTVTQITSIISNTAVNKTKPLTTRKNYFPSTSATSFFSTNGTTKESTVEKSTTIVETESENYNTNTVYRSPSTTANIKNICTISINCSQIFKNPNKLKTEKEAFVPSNGEILKPVTVEFENGETAFDILRRVCKTNTCSDNCRYCQSIGIQLEYEYTPGYGNYYIEGIHQIYEKDCGAKSGWMYKVNGNFPNQGCSSYPVKNGDRIEFVYTCDLGEDIGAEF